jgi:ligand-binding sensor domain-containing protein
VGTNSGIYYRLNDSSNFVNVSSINDKILTIQKDYFGAVWFGGVNGLYRVSPAKSISQTTFDTISEISDTIFPIYALENNGIGKGYLLAGTKKGLMFINDSQINEILYAYPYLFLATNKGAFRIKLDGTREWVNTTSALTEAKYNDIISLVSGVPKRLIAGSDFGVIISDNDGDSWTQTFSANEEILDIMEINTGVNKGVYITTSSVIYKSTDNGLNWSEYLLASDFEDINEFSQFFAVLKYT